MPKKEWTEAEKAAFAEKMRKAREEKVKEAAEAVEVADENLKNINEEAPTPPPVAPTEETVSGEQNIDALKQQIEELKQNQLLMQQLLSAQNNLSAGPQIAGGRVVGTVEKHTVDKSHYPDPRPRLMQEPKLQRFAFPINYDLTWEVQVTNYETKDGINTKEPRFQIELRQIQMDDEGNPTNGRYILRRASFHEDPQAAVTIANENGIPVDSVNEKAFLDEMRYLRIRDWLLEWFYRPRTDNPKNKKELVFGNRIVEFLEINSEQPQDIPFNEIKNR